MNKLFGPLIAMGIVGLVIFFAVTDGSSADLTGYFKGEITDVQEKDFKVGSGDISIIEYGDFECPACAAFFPVASQIKTDLIDDVTFVYRHLPLTNIHPRAMAAHRASEAAAAQGRFFEMHDLLYEKQSEWNSRATASITGALEIIEGYAEQLSLDMDQYRIDVESQEAQDNIKIHLESASQVGANSTPSIFVNGERINFFSGFAFEDMQRIVENAKAGRPLESTEEQEAETIETVDSPEAIEEEPVEIENPEN